MKKLIYIALFSIILSACREAIDVNIPEKEKKIVLNSLITPDSLVKVNLTKSLGILEQDKSLTFLKTAEVKLFEDDIFIENLVFDTLGFYYSTVFPKINKTYKITATYENLQEIKTKTIIPEPVEISDVVYNLDIINQTVQWYDEINHISYDTIIPYINKFTINVSLNDPIVKDNYYLLTYTAKMPIIDGKDTIGYKLAPIMYSSNSLSYANQIYMNGLTGYVISDEYFNGELFTFLTEINSFYSYDGSSFYGFSLNGPIFINLYSISKDFYEYVITSNKYNNADGNPLAEPVNVFTNITNGFGLFTGYSLSQDSIIVE